MNKNTKEQSLIDEELNSFNLELSGFVNQAQEQWKYWRDSLNVLRRKIKKQASSLKNETSIDPEEYSNMINRMSRFNGQAALCNSLAEFLMKVNSDLKLEIIQLIEDFSSIEDSDEET